ncbi:MAG: hypothetical protein H7A25_17770 [Leptospiraceae bacterium]|nr:hypothetical protein [Leptospiraceae bacterium]
MKQIQIGILKIDSGKLLLCDPLYLEDWQKESRPTKREYIHTKTEQIFTYGTDFQNYSDKIGDKTIKQLIQDGTLKLRDVENNNDFSYHAITQKLSKLGFAQFDFSNENPGKAVSILSDDGEYPVFAELEEDKLIKVWIDFS